MMALLLGEYSLEYVRSSRAISFEKKSNLCRRAQNNFLELFSHHGENYYLDFVLTFNLV